MSDESNNELLDLSCCAACGVAAEVDGVELLPCGDCDLVKYCSDECQDDHKSEHKEACKIRFEELLFKQPECSHLGDCPICFLPLSLDQSKSYLMPCCSKEICMACRFANHVRALEMELIHSCPFCREPVPQTKEEVDKRTMKRVAMNDPAAMCSWGVTLRFKGDFSGAVECWTKASELGDADAHFKLACMYGRGLGVEYNEGRVWYHMEGAAIAGHPRARHFLGLSEYYDSGNVERAVKHWIIASNLGEDDSIKELMKAFKEGHVSKDDLAAALRAHKAAVDATKSPQRVEAEEFYLRNYIG